MSIVLPALAVAFASFYVWLGVRIYNRRERWAKWTLGAVLILPVLYVLGLGPACNYLTRHVDDMDDGRISAPCRVLLSIYGPLGHQVVYGPELIRNPLQLYLEEWSFRSGPDEPERMAIPIGDGQYMVGQSAD